MKLWKKISIICSIILIMIVTICNIILIFQSKNSILELTYEQAHDKQYNLTSSFSEMAKYYSDENDSPSMNYSLIKYCFVRFADSSSVLIKDNEIVYKEVSLNPEYYLKLSNDGIQQQYNGKINGAHILIIGNKILVQDTAYSVFVIEDISSVYNGITQMILKFIFISISGVLLGLMLIILLVRHATKPLGELSEATKRIAAGSYNDRAFTKSHDEVGELANDFNAMADAIQKHIAELTETAERQRLFIGGVTHEFKTPLTTLILNADTLKNANMDEDETNNSIAYIERQCKWLERLTQKLLKLITLKDHIELKKVSVYNLFCRVHESMTEALEKRGTPLALNCYIESLDLDIDLMQSVLINLVDNASKASERGQTIILQAYDHTIEVQDKGSGIPDNEIQRIMEPFYMLDCSRSKKYGGSGLGLALVKEIVDAHSAQLVIESVQGQGTAVRISFS